MEEITQDICRICLIKTGCISIYEKRFEMITMADMIMALTDVLININDNMPSNVCLYCTRRVENAFKVKQDCESSDVKLRQLFADKKLSIDDEQIKTELEYCQEMHPVDCEIEIKKETKEEEEAIALQQLGQNESAQSLNISSTIVVIDGTNATSNDDMNFFNCDTQMQSLISCEELDESIEQLDDIDKDQDDEQEDEKPLKTATVTNKDVDKWKTLENEQCEYCDKSFQTRASLSNHMRVHKVAPHLCSICGKEFKLRQNLNNHFRTHTGEKPFECDICFKKFSTRSNVFNHRRTHSDEKPYVCDVCGKQFPTISHLRNHNLSHVPIAERKYKCEKCNKTFRDRKIFKRHLNIHNGVRNEMCEICGKKFCNKNDVTRHHKTVHLGIKKYVCSVCGKAFSNSSNLESHFRIHTGEKPFECKYCDAKFNQSTPLVKHTKLHLERGDRMKVVVPIPDAD